MTSNQASKEVAMARTTKATHKPSALEYGLYFGVSFLVFLPVAAVKTVLPRRAPRFGQAAPRRGVIGEARAMAGDVVPFVFMH